MGTEILDRRRPDVRTRKNARGLLRLVAFAVARSFHEQITYADGLTSLNRHSGTQRKVGPDGDLGPTAHRRRLRK
jgi:hypothetical protein